MKLKANRRALYKYTCGGCGKQRYSFVYERATDKKLCRKCIKDQPPTNMRPILPEYAHATD